MRQKLIFKIFKILLKIQSYALITCIFHPTLLIFENTSSYGLRPYLYLIKTHLNTLDTILNTQNLKYVHSMKTAMILIKYLKKEIIMAH